MITGFDHIAITVSDLDATCRFYELALDAEVEEAYEIGGMIAVKRVAVGKAIMNIHQQGNGIDLVAASPLPGSADICFRWTGSIENAAKQLEARGIEIVEGPVDRPSSDNTPGRSVYIRDPDGNLVELLAA